jgi:hypothetical protein
MHNINVFFIFILLSVNFIIGSTALADGSFIDKIYHPYVQPHEKEVEWRWTMQKDNDDQSQDNAQKHRLAYGQSINENWFAEIYLIGEKNRNQNFKLTATELELLWQITEQGEYDADWGMLFEVEHEQNTHISEVASALLIEKEWHKWVGTANLYLIYEWGNKIENELETAMALQGRYRYSRALEPAIEFYSSDSSEGIGPVLLGNFRLSGRKKIHWEAGIIFALDNETADETLKLLIEFEF